MHRRLPSLTALRAFEAAARHESFSRAAEELFVTHAAISRQIRELETDLKLSLFRRTGRGVKLTEAGDAYARKITRAFDRIGEATRELSTARGRRELRISVEVGFASAWLVHRLGRFQTRHPDIDIVLDASDALIDFRSSEAEIGIRCGTGRYPGLQASEIVKLIAFPVAAPKLVRSISLSEPAGLARTILLHQDSKRWWGNYLARAGVSAALADAGPIMPTHHAVEAAIGGQGVALGDNVVAADALIDGRLVRPFASVDAEVAYYFVGPEGRKDSAAAKSFKAWILEEMIDTQARLSPLLAEQPAEPR
ncbi:MAG: transcriptional regulator GcvA [Hyphomicrobiaceae bacterium]